MDHETRTRSGRWNSRCKCDRHRRRKAASSARDSASVTRGRRLGRDRLICPRRPAHRLASEVGGKARFVRTDVTDDASLAGRHRRPPASSGRYASRYRPRRPDRTEPHPRDRTATLTRSELFRRTNRHLPRGHGSTSSAGAAAMPPHRAVWRAGSAASSSTPRASPPSRARSGSRTYAAGQGPGSGLGLVAAPISPLGIRVMTIAPVARSSPRPSDGRGEAQPSGGFGAQPEADGPPGTSTACSYSSRENDYLNGEAAASTAPSASARAKIKQLATEQR